MSRGEQKTEKLLESKSTAGVEQVEFQVRRGITLAAIQVNVVNEAQCASVTASACDICATCFTFTEAAHGYVDGLVGQFTTSCALPACLCLATNYYIINVDACTYSVASSRALALVGTVLDIGDAGTGNQTFTPVAVSCTPATNGTITLHASVDGSNFESGSISCISNGLDVNGINYVDSFDVGFNVIQVDVDVLLGQWTVSIDASGK